MTDLLIAKNIVDNFVDSVADSVAKTGGNKCELSPLLTSSGMLLPLSPTKFTASPKSATNFPSQKSFSSRNSLMRQASAPATPTDVALAFDPLLNCGNKDKKVLRSNVPQIPELAAHVPSFSMDDKKVVSCLAEIATHLSISKPSQDEESRMEDHMATLGEKPKHCTGSRKTHRHHRRILSLDSKFLGTKLKSSRDLKKSKKGTRTHSRDSTPPDLDFATKNIMDLTLPIDLNYGSGIRTVVKPSSIKRSTLQHGKSHPVVGTSFLTNGASASLRSSELQPSDHQIDLPTSEEVLTQARLCALLEDYRFIDQNFIFSNLIGMTRLGMEGFIQSGATPLAMNSNLVSAHVPIVKNLMECMAFGDLVVEGFFHTESADGAVDDRVEVAILRSESQRKIITVWRGATYLQEKPVDKKEVKAANTDKIKGLETFHPDHLTAILPSFRRAYFEDKLETKVFDLINRLAEENPFFDLVCTGHSFGAALATMSASRYATSFPMMRVSCLAFRCPKIGGIGWRLHVHSLPNLKIIRIENGLYLEYPSESILTHVGHSIVLDNISSDSSLASTSANLSPRSRTRKSYDNVRAFAYKFDKGSNHVQTSKSRVFRLGKSGRNKQGKMSHTVQSYVNTITQFTHMGIPWVVDYTGENVGKGVTGMRDEKRNMV